MDTNTRHSFYPLQHVTRNAIRVNAPYGARTTPSAPATADTSVTPAPTSESKSTSESTSTSVPGTSHTSAPPAQSPTPHPDTHPRRGQSRLRRAIDRFTQPPPALVLGTYVPKRLARSASPAELDFSRKIIRLKYRNKDAIDYFTNLLIPVLTSAACNPDPNAASSAEAIAASVASSIAATDADTNAASNAHSTSQSPMRRDRSVIVIPSHNAQRKITGIRIVAQRAAHYLGLTDGTHCLQRISTTPQMSGGGPRSEQLHLDTITIVQPELIKGKDVILIDDVISSGCSMRACIALLLSAGAKSIQCIALSQTITAS